jgi:hypothetical protein
MLTIIPFEIRNASKTYILTVIQYFSRGLVILDRKEDKIKDTQLERKKQTCYYLQRKSKTIYRQITNGASTKVARYKTNL